MLKPQNQEPTAAYWYLSDLAQLYTSLNMLNQSPINWIQQFFQPLEASFDLETSHRFFEEHKDDAELPSLLTTPEVKQDIFSLLLGEDEASNALPGDFPAPDNFLSRIQSTGYRSISELIQVLDNIGRALFSAYAGQTAETYASLHEVIIHRLRSALAFQDQPDALIVFGDLSGIQNFLYTVSSEDALRTLRGRSFFIELLQKHLVYRVWNTLHLTPWQIYSQGGGTFQVLVPKHADVVQQITQIRKSLNNWLFNEYGIKLYSNLFTIEIDQPTLKSADELGDRIHEALLQSKNVKWKEQAPLIASMHEKKEFTAYCRVCHQDIYVTSDEANQEKPPCPLCAASIHWGKALRTSGDFYIQRIPVDDTKKREEDIQIESFVYRYSSDPDGAQYQLNPPDENHHAATIYWAISPYIQAHTRQDTSLETLADARNEAGGYLGALRMDVDNLGQLFQKHLNTFTHPLLARSVLSRTMNLFFKSQLPDILGESYQSKITIPDSVTVTHRAVDIIYAGGDDLFMVGNLADIVESALDIRSAFTRFTKTENSAEPLISVSAGVTVHDPHFPLYQIARLSEAAEHAAKNYSENGTFPKNRLSLFYSPALLNRKQKILAKFDEDRISLSVPWESITGNESPNLYSIVNQLVPLLDILPHGLIHKLFAVNNYWQEEGVMYMPHFFRVNEDIREYLKRRSESEVQNFADVLAKLYHPSDIRNTQKRMTTLHIPLIWAEFYHRNQ